MFKFVLYYIIWSVIKFWKRINPLKLLWNEPKNSLWLRPVGKFEEFLEIAHQHGIMISSYSITINSKEPLQEEQLKAALRHLQCKVPTLQLCIRKRGSTLWFSKMKPSNIDFEIMEKYDFEKEFFNMNRHKFDVENGPMWCVKLLPQFSYERCPMPELKKEFPHQYKLLFGFHHAITDGSSTIKICGHFLNILNAVISKKAVDDNLLLAYFADGEETEALLMKAGLKMAFNPAEYQKYHNLATKQVTEILFLKAYPPPLDVPPRTISLEYDLGEAKTAKFLKKCKEERVTIHAAFSTIINAALVDMLKMRGIDQDIYMIPNYHTVNQRRYWENKDSSNAFGAHLGKLSILSSCPTNMADNIWEHARTFKTSLDYQLNNMGPMKESIATFLALPSDFNISQMMCDNNYFPKPYYITTNMGNLAQSFPGTGEHVQATSIRRTTSSANTNFSHVMQSFRGRFLYGIDYEAATVSRDTAQLHMDTIFNILDMVLL